MERQMSTIKAERMSGGERNEVKLISRDWALKLDRNCNVTGRGGERKILRLLDWGVYYTVGLLYILEWPWQRTTASNLEIQERTKACERV